jgi:hypothetical protein
MVFSQAEVSEYRKVSERVEVSAQAHTHYQPLPGLDDTPITNFQKALYFRTLQAIHIECILSEWGSSVPQGELLYHA